MDRLHELTAGQLFAVGAGYVAACFAIGIGIGALLDRRPR